jgi:hypothetical protein
VLAYLTYLPYLLCCILTYCLTYQVSADGLMLCWPADGRSFLDRESGLWTVEWQLARWVPDNASWTTAIPTQRLSPGAGRALADGGLLNLSQADLTSISAFATLTHAHRYRLGVRAVNRAGVVSCGPSLEACRERARRRGLPIGPECACADPTGEVDNWAASQLDVSVPFSIDVVAPSCLFAVAWLCDPATPPGEACDDISFANPFGRPGDAQDGQQADPSKVHVRWKGFFDLDSGVTTCEPSALLTYPPDLLT